MSALDQLLSEKYRDNTDDIASAKSLPVEPSDTVKDDIVDDVAAAETKATEPDVDVTSASMVVAGYADYIQAGWTNVELAAESSLPMPEIVAETIIEEPVVEQPVAEAPVVETPVVETPVVETPVVEEPVAEAAVAEEPVVEAPVVETPVVETPVAETPVVETPVVEPPVVEESTIEEPVVEAPVAEEPTIEAPAVEAPAMEKPICETQEDSTLLSDTPLSDVSDSTEQICDEAASDIAEPALQSASEAPTAVALESESKQEASRDAMTPNAESADSQMSPAALPEEEETQMDDTKRVNVTAPDPAPFKPQWEVDEFLWPAICSEIEERLGDELDATVHQFRVSCEAGRNVLMMTSDQRGNGRTTMLLTLARRAAQSGMRVAVVDLDHREPELASQLGIDAEVGLESLVDGHETAESICISAVEDGVALLPMTGRSESWKCVAPEVRSAIGSVRTHFDLVLVDSTPDSTDVPASDDGAWGAVIVRSQETSDAASEAMIEQLEKRNIGTIGVINNFAA